MSVLEVSVEDLRREVAVEVAELRALVETMDRELEEVQWCVEDLDRSSKTYRWLLGVLVKSLGKAMASMAMDWLYPEPSGHGFGEHNCPGRASVPKRRAAGWSRAQLVAMAAEHGVRVRHDDSRLEMLRALRRHVPELRR